jgi:hypothetical protein
VISRVSSARARSRAVGLALTGLIWHLGIIEIS